MSTDSPFISLLSQRIATAGISGREFARRIGMEAGTLSAIKAGKSRFPLALIGVACRALALNETQSEEFSLAVHLTHTTDKIRDEFESLRRAGGLVIALRLHQAQLHAERSGRPLDIKALEDTGLDPWDLRKATVTGAGSPAAMKAVAKALGVTVGWILMGMDDPQWYRDAMGTMSLPNDAAWSAERARLGFTQ